MLRARGETWGFASSSYFNKSTGYRQKPIQSELKVNKAERIIFFIQQFENFLTIGNL